MAEITTNFRDKNYGDLGKNLVSKEYLLSVYPKLASSILGSGNLIIGVSPNLVNTSIPINFDGFNDWRSISQPIESQSSSSTNGELYIIKNNGTLWTLATAQDFNQKRLRFNMVTSLSQEFTSATNWKQVSAGLSHVAAIKTDGTLWSWGQFLNTTNSTPVRELTSSTNWKQVVCGNQRTLAIKTDGTLWAWGQNRYWGDLPIPFAYNWNPSTGARVSGAVLSYSIPVQVGTANNWKSILSVSHQGGLFAPGNGVSSFSEISKGSVNYLLKTNNTLWVWGLLPGPGVLRVPGAFKLTPCLFNIEPSVTWKTVPSTLIPQNQTIVAADEHGSSIKNDGSMFSFGNSYYQNSSLSFGVVHPFAGNVTYARESTSSTNWKQIDCNRETPRTLAIKTDGSLWVTGITFNGVDVSGRVNLSSQTFRTFTQIGTDFTWRQVSVGSAFAAAIKTDGSLWTWGISSFVPVGTYRIYTLSNGLVDGNTTPIRESTLSTWSQVSVGANHGAAIKTDGTLWTWGANSYGKLGVNDTVSRTTLVREFTSSNNWVQVDCGINHTAAIKSDGTLWTWGFGFDAQLGDGDRSTKLTPVRESTSSTNWKYVNASFHNTAAIKTDGTLWLWGSDVHGLNANRKLSYNNVTYESRPSQEFTSSTNWNTVSLSYRTAIALKNDGTLWGWGSNILGSCGVDDWKLNIIATPVQESAANIWSNVSASTGSSQGINLCSSVFYGIKPNGTLWRYTHDVSTASIYGPNSYLNNVTPLAQVGPGNNWAKVFSSLSSVAAIKTDGTLWQGGRVKFNPQNSGYNFFYRYNFPYTGTDVASLVQEGSFSTNWKTVVPSASIIIASKSDPV
jgi:alpha-tubulin suppressor-like RCC1 family protein